jgi:general secretion pathway protein L
MEAGLMAQAFLGLDISARTIKAVLFTRKGLAGGHILDARILDIDECGGLDEALKKLAENKKFTEASCCLALPPADVMFRQVNLPFRDDNRIRKTLAFELEPLLPVSIDDVVTDYVIVPHDGLLVAALTKDSIAEWIKKVEAGLGKVSIIDVSIAALAAQIPAENFSGGSGVVLDIGARSTAVAFYEEGSLVQIRSLAFGGASITEALSQDLSISTAQAEQKKMSGDIPAGCPGTENVCRHFCAELQNTIEFMKLNGALRNPPMHLLVTGGASLFVPLQQELEKSLALTPETLDLLRLKRLDLAEGVRLQPQVMNTAIAAALRFSAGRKSYNLQQGELEKKNARRNFGGQFKWAAIIAGIILLLAATNQALDYTLKTQRLDSLKKQIALIFKKDFPDASNMIDPVQQLKTKLEENKKSFGSYKGSSETTVLNILKDVSGLIAASMDIVIYNFSYENGVINMQGEAKNVDEISAVKNELMKSRYFKEVTMGSTSLAKDGGKVNFDLRINVK